MSGLAGAAGGQGGSAGGQGGSAGGQGGSAGGQGGSAGGQGGSASGSAKRPFENLYEHPLSFCRTDGDLPDKQQIQLSRQVESDLLKQENYKDQLLPTINQGDTANLQPSLRSIWNQAGTVKESHTSTGVQTYRVGKNIYHKDGSKTTRINNIVGLRLLMFAGFGIGSLTDSPKIIEENFDKFAHSLLCMGYSSVEFRYARNQRAWEAYELGWKNYDVGYESIGFHGTGMQSLDGILTNGIFSGTRDLFSTGVGIYCCVQGNDPDDRAGIAFAAHYSEQKSRMPGSTRIIALVLIRYDKVVQLNQHNARSLINNTNQLLYAEDTYTVFAANNICLTHVPIGFIQLHMIHHLDWVNYSCTFLKMVSNTYTEIAKRVGRNQNQTFIPRESWLALQKALEEKKKNDLLAPHADLLCRIYAALTRCEPSQKIKDAAKEFRDVFVLTISKEVWSETMKLEIADSDKTSGHGRTRLGQASCKRDVHIGDLVKFDSKFTDPGAHHDIQQQLLRQDIGGWTVELMESNCFQFKAINFVTVSDDNNSEDLVVIEFSVAVKPNHPKYQTALDSFRAAIDWRALNWTKSACKSSDFGLLNKGIHDLNCIPLDALLVPAKYVHPIL